jgi:hypothetical protein
MNPMVIFAMGPILSTKALEESQLFREAEQSWYACFPKLAAQEDHQI